MFSSITPLAIQIYGIKGKSFTKLATILLILASNCRYHILISAINGKPLPDFTRVSIDTYPFDRLVLPRARCAGAGTPMIRVRPPCRCRNRNTEPNKEWYCWPMHAMLE
jgi:hypothetical protein